MSGLPFKTLPAGRNENLGITSQSPKGFNFPMGKYKYPQPIVFGGQELKNPIAMIEDEVALGQQQINIQFDQAKYELDQKTYAKPEEYIQAINELKSQVAQAGLQLRQKSEAKLFSMKQMMDLVDEGRMSFQTGQRVMWRIAGLDEENINAIMPEPKPRNLIQEHATITGELGRLQNILNQFAPDEKTGILYPSMDPKDDPETPDTKKEPASQLDIEQYLMARNAFEYYSNKELEIFEQMTPGAKIAIAGQRAVMEQTTRLKRPSKLWALSPVGTIGKIRSMKKQIKEVKVLYAKNPKTGERIMSTDGGKTWAETR